MENMIRKSELQVPDTGTRVLDNTRPFLCSIIVNFWYLALEYLGHFIHPVISYFKPHMKRITCLPSASKGFGHDEMMSIPDPFKLGDDILLKALY